MDGRNGGCGSKWVGVEKQPPSFVASSSGTAAWMEHYAHRCQHRTSHLFVTPAHSTGAWRGPLGLGAAVSAGAGCRVVPRVHRPHVHPLGGHLLPACSACRRVCCHGARSICLRLWTAARGSSLGVRERDRDMLPDVVCIVGPVVSEAVTCVMVAPPSLPLSFVQWGEWFEELLMAPSPWVVLLMVGHAFTARMLRSRRLVGVP
jgi:hypothetical protein